MTHVTVPDLPSRVQFSVGGASTGPFAFDFSYFAASDIKVYKGTTLLTITTDYTLTGDAGTDGGYEGGSVTLVVAASSTTITIVRDVPIERVSDFPTAGSFNRDVLNSTLDKYVAMMRQLESALDRALLGPITDATSLAMELPASSSRATKLLGFDADGEPVVTTQTLAQIEAGSTAAAASAAAALVSQLAAVAAQTAAEAVYDTFDDRFLGSKAADPTLDNDGNALATGAIYWNTGGAKFKVWTGAAWIDAFPSGTVPIGSGGTGQTTADAAVYALISGATNDVAPNLANDKIGWAKASGTTGRSMSFQAFWNQLTSLTAYTTLNAADEVAVRDGSGGGNGVRKITVANFFAGVAGLTSLPVGTLDPAADRVPIVDQSATTAKYALAQDLGRLVQHVYTQTSAVATGTTTIPQDDTIPQNTEGDQYMSLAITPKATGNILVIEIGLYCHNSAAVNQILALFQDSTAGALKAVAALISAGGGAVFLYLRHIMAAGTVSATTFKARSGGSGAGTTTFNGNASARLFGGVAGSFMSIKEYAP